MDEMFTRDKKPSRRVEPANETKQKTYGKKLKNELSRSEAMRSKFRTGKADNKQPSSRNHYSDETSRTSFRRT